MPRYVVAPPTRTSWDDPAPAPALPHPLAYVSEPVKTGLLDPNGRDIYRVPDQIGFLVLKNNQ